MCELHTMCLLHSLPQATGDYIIFPRPQVISNKVATDGLIKVGARTALSFAFAFLMRAWKSGEDKEMCTEVLQEAISVLHDMPVALLFDMTTTSNVWADMVDRTIQFLFSVCLG